MSCRVIGHCVELAVLQDIIKNAKKLNVSTLLGTYIPTDRNMIVKDHYKKLGFIKISKNSEAENWELNISDYRNKDIPMILKYIDR